MSHNNLSVQEAGKVIMYFPSRTKTLYISSINLTNNEGSICSIEANIVTTLKEESLKGSKPFDSIL